MRLSTKGRYAVMAMADLAKNGTDRAVSLAEIAARQEISLSYLEQLFARLRKGGLVKSVRGRAAAIGWPRRRARWSWPTLFWPLMSRSAPRAAPPTARRVAA